jgi:hypothetical protein
MTRIGTLFIALTSWIVFGGLVALAPSAAQADCAQWDLSGHWEIQQRNGIAVNLDLTQTGTDVQGTGFFVAGECHSGFPFGTKFCGGTQGSVTGTIDGNGNIQLNADWGGVYRGGVGSDAFIGGTTFAVNDPGNQVGWRGDRAATCQFAGEPSATTPPSHAESPLEEGGVLKSPGTDIFKKTTTPSVPPPPPPPQGGGGAVEPGGKAFKDANGDDIGIPKDSKWLVLEKRMNPVWYKLQTPPLTPVPGWVWGDDVTIGP